MFWSQPWYVWLAVGLYFLFAIGFFVYAEYRIYQTGGDAIWFGKK